jgi:hypothetical protein
MDDRWMEQASDTHPGKGKCPDGINFFRQMRTGSDYLIESVKVTELMPTVARALRTSITRCWVDPSSAKI